MRAFTLFFLLASAAQAQQPGPQPTPEPQPTVSYTDRATCLHDLAARQHDTARTRSAVLRGCLAIR